MAAEDLQSSAHAEAGTSVDASPPPLVALFLIKFDLKVGNTIAWKRAANDVPLEGVVEYKSLPSGLHNVKEDLVYFSHDQYAGVSAFAKADASEAERNARFVAVGAMVPFKHGRLGRAWLHAGNLTRLAKSLVDDSSDIQPLEKYWEEHKSTDSASDDDPSSQLSPFTLAQRKHRALSSTTLATDDKQTLPNYHPALSLCKYVDVFGPLIFPLHRAALLRKRILIITAAPVREACEFAYHLSVSTSTPLSLASSLILPSESLVRLRPLFNVGVHDIPFLEKLGNPGLHNQTGGNGAVRDDEPDNYEESQRQGWIACTTDEILAMKPRLYDVVVELPSSHLGHQGNKRPIIKTSDGKAEVKASQRDFKRWRMLKRILDSISSSSQLQHRENGDFSDEDEPLLGRSTTSLPQSDQNDSDEDTEAVESATWSELAYSSFLWWASAGERSEMVMEEENQDKSLLSDLQKLAERLNDERRYQDDDDDDDDQNQGTESSPHSPGSDRTIAGSQDARVEMALISYFHRLTKNLFEVCSDILEDDIGDDEGSVVDGVPNIDREVLRSMGLDGWNAADQAFVKAFFELWYEREVDLQRMTVDCCGMKIF